MIKKRILALLLAVSLVMPSVLPASAAEPQSNGKTVEAEAGTDTSEAEESGSKESDTSETDKSETRDEALEKDDTSQNTETVPTPERQPEKVDDGSDVKEPESEEKPQKDSYKVILDVPEFGTLSFPMEEKENRADEKDPWTPMQEALKRQEELEKKGQETERTAAPDEEVTVHVSSDYGYELTSLQAISENTKEVVLELKVDEEGKAVFQMPREDIRIHAEYKELDPEDSKTAEENQKQLEQQEAEAAAANDSRTMMRAAVQPRKSIYLYVPSSKLWYGSYNTRYYTTNEGKYAYCIEPRRKAPKAGYYSASVMYNTNVRKAAYYAYGGPGYSKYRASYGNIWDGSQKNEYIYSHIIISYIYAKYYLGSNSEANYAFYGLSSSAKNKLIAKANNLLKLSAPPSGYTCYTMSTSYSNGNKRAQAMLCQTYNSGSLNLKKVSSNTAMTNGNDMYSLNGAQYGVYSNSSCTSKVGTLTTNANGVSNTITLNPGTYYIKETKAPLGYELSKTVTTAVVPDSGTKTVTVSDKPIDDPAAIVIKKLDRITGEEVQGGASLAGAQFTVRYYDGLYTKDNLPQNASRTWVIESKMKDLGDGKETAVAILEDSYKVSGDPFFKVGNFVTIPRGTVTIQETKAPEGYENNLSLTDQNGQGGDDLYLVQIQKEGDMSSISGGNVFEGTDTVMRGDFSFTKKNGATNKIMANIPFKITNVASGEAHTVYTDENGYFSSQSSYVKHSQNTNREQAKSGLWFGDLSILDDNEGALPFGDYTIEELSCSANAGLKMYKGKFQIDQNGMVWEFGTIVNSQIEIATQVLDTTTGSSTIGSMNDEYGYIIGDEVSIDGLSTGYAELKLKDKATGEYIKDAKGNDLKAGGEITEGYDGYDGMANLGLEVPTEVLHTLQGKTIVACVRVYALTSNGTPNYSKLLGAHEDLDDLNETLYFPSLETTMTEKTTELHDSSVSGASVFEDTVKVQNIPARFYELESSFIYKFVGTLVDQNGTPVKGADGKNITASTAVKQMSDRCFDDTFTLTYNVPESVKQKYAGQTLHSFVELWGSVYGDQDFLSLIAFERDVKNPSQTISLPIIESTNVSKDILEYDAKGIKDKVNMKGLTIGQTYTLEGQIVDPTTGQVIVQSRSLTYGKDDFDYQYVIPGAGANYSVTKNDDYGTIFQTENGYFRLNEDEVYVFCEADGTQLGVKTLTRDEFESELFPGDSFEEERPLSGYYFFTAEEKDVEKYVPFSFNIETLRGKKYVITEKLYHGKGKTALPLDTTDDYTITLHGKGTLKNGTYVDSLRLGFSHKEDISFNIGAIKEPNGLTNPRFYFEVNGSVVEAEQLDYETLTQSGSSDKKHFDVYVVYQQDYSMLEYQQNDKSIFATKGFDITKATDVVYGQRQDSPKGAVDISAKGTGTVMAYYEGTVLHVDSITPFTGKHNHLYPAYPEDCSYLYSGFSNLTTFDFTTSNANTEFMKNLLGLFYNCPKLTELNVTNLVNETNKVRTIWGTFMKCPELVTVTGLDTWNVEKVIELIGPFNESPKIGDSVASQMKNWNLQNCTTVAMLMAYTSITNTNFMSNWDLKNVKDAQGMMLNCSLLKTADISDVFDETLEDATNMFLDCTSLKSVNWGTTKLNGLKTAGGMFARSGIESIDLSGLFGTNLQNCENMFLDCKSVVTIDLSDNQLYSVKNGSGMFGRCSNLKTIYVSNNFTGLTTSDNMFLDDRAIVGGSGVKFNAAKIDKSMANYTTGYLTYKAAPARTIANSLASSSVGTKVANTVENVKAAEDGAKKKNVDQEAQETMSPKTAEDKKENPVVSFFSSLFSADAEPKETKEADLSRLDLMDTHNDLNDENQTFYVADIQTELTNADGEHFFTPNGTASLTDKVTYSGLKPNQEYTLTGQLINKDTGAVVVQNTVRFTPSATTGTINVPFSFDASGLGGVTLVAYETLSGTVSSYGIPVGTYDLAEHKDKNDENQTVTSMSISTSAADKKTNTKMVMPTSDAAVVDTVSYKGAVTGQTYRLEATLMQKYKEGAAVDSTGNIVTGSAEFTPTAKNGSQVVELSFDATSMPSGEYVVFEKLYALNGDKKELWTTHEDYNDAAQTITITGFDTNIYEADTLTNMAYPKKDMEVHDIVTYTGFQPGETYTVDWKLVDVATKKDYVDAAGKTVKKTQSFTPDEADGEFEIVETFDGSKLNGQNLTAVTTVKLGSSVLFEHNKNLDNEYETISIPGLDTVATETGTGAKEVYAIPNISITDKITYQKLQVGLEHIVKTSIVDKKTGEVLQNNKREPLTFESEIAPDEADGVYEAVLEFNGSGLGGVEAVVFQEIWLGDTLIAQHKDLNDTDQTFTFKEMPKRTAEVVKRIKASDFHKEHGNITFLFKMAGEDVCGETHTYYREITFTEEYVKVNTVNGYVEKSASFEQVPMGTYTVTEEDSARYKLAKVENIKNAVVEGKSAKYDLITNETASSKFTNSKYEWQGYSDTSIVINNILKKPSEEKKPLLKDRNVIIIGERDGIPGPAIMECVESAGGNVVSFDTEFFGTAAVLSNDMQNKIIKLTKQYKKENLIVILGVNDPEIAYQIGETLTTGDPLYVGPLTGVALGLDVYHICEPEIKELIDDTVYEEQVAMMEPTVDIEEISAKLQEIRSTK